MKNRSFVITGGPGSGKSTLLAALSTAGYRCIPESGRAIIQEQLACGGSALPWRDRAAFAAAMWERDMLAYRSVHESDKLRFFDRGLPDVIGYLRLCGLPVPASYWQEARRLRYADVVFLAPTWPQIYQQDAERKQTLEEAERTCQEMVRTYTELGYRTIQLPQASVPDRAEFVLQITNTRLMFES